MKKIVLILIIILVTILTSSSAAAYFISMHKSFQEENSFAVVPPSPDTSSSPTNTSISSSTSAPTLTPTIAAENIWVSKAEMQQGRNCKVAVVNQKIYAIGGNIGGFFDTNEEYDPITNTWTFKASMPTPRSHFGIATFDNKIYCIGGYIPGGPTDVNEVYDPSTDTWATKAPMPTPRLNIQANVVNQRIFLIGGNPNGTLNEVYDPANDTWVTKAPIPFAVSSYASTVVDHKIYVITSSQTQIYDAENDSWSKGATAPLSVIFPSAGATTGEFAPERIYVFGHDVDNKTPYWQLTSTRNFIAQSYDPKTNSWTVCASASSARFDTSVAVVNDSLYVIGGFTIEFPKDTFTLNSSYIPNTKNEQYTPFEYGQSPGRDCLFNKN